MDFKKRPLGPVKPAVEQADADSNNPTDNKVEQPVIYEPKRSRAKLILSILLALAVIAASALAYLWLQERQAAAEARDEVARQESINASLKSALAEREEQEQEALEQPEVVDQSDAILQASSQHVCQADECTDVVMEIMKISYGVDATQPSFAVVSLDRPGDFDANLYLKQDNADSEWLVVHEGDDMSLNLRNQYSFPAELFDDSEQ